MKKSYILAVLIMALNSCTVCYLTGEIYPTSAQNGKVKACVECEGNLGDLKKMLKLK